MAPLRECAPSVRVEIMIEPLLRQVAILLERNPDNTVSKNYENSTTLGLCAIHHPDDRC